MRTKYFFRSGILNFLFQATFLVLMFLLGRQVPLDIDTNFRIVVLFGIVLVPSIIWTLFFYLQDRLNPEPLSHIIAAFVAGMAAAGLAAIPLYRIVFRIKEWMYASSTLFVLGSFFIMAFVFSGLSYIILRYGFYPLKEFNEPVDGMVYGAVSGAGFALAESLYQLFLHPEYTLFVISYMATTHILIYSGVGSVIGYLVGRAKFQGKNIQVFSLAAVVSGIILLGIYHLLNEFIFISGFHYAFWWSFLLTLVYSLLIILFCYIKMRKLTEKDLQADVPVRSKFDPLVALLLIFLLLTAYLVSFQGLKGKKYENRAYGMSFYYPHSLSLFSFSRTSPALAAVGRGTRTIFYAENGTTPCFSLSIKVHKKLPPDTRDNLAQFVEFPDPRSLVVSDTAVGGRRGKRLSYSFLEEISDFRDDFPRLIDVHTDVVPVEDHIFTFTYKAPAEIFKQGLPQYTGLLESVKWKRKTKEGGKP